MLSLRLITIETKRERERKRKNGQHARTEEEEEEERETKELAFCAAAKEKKKRKENRPVGRSVGRRLRGVDFAFENTERTHLNLHPFCICGYYILKFLCENSRAVVVERVFPAAREERVTRK